MKFFYSIRIKIIAWLLLITLISAVSSFIVLKSYDNALEAVNDIINTDSRRILALQEIKNAASELETLIKLYGIKEGHTTQELSDQKDKFLALAEVIGNWRKEFEINFDQEKDNTDSYGNFSHRLNSQTQLVVGDAILLINKFEKHETDQAVKDQSQKLDVEILSLKTLVADQIQIELINLDNEKSLAQENAGRAQRYNWMRVAGVILLSAAIGYWVSNNISKQIRRVSAGALEISAGRLDKKIVTNSNDEIGQLAEAFNAMATRLKDSFGTLEEKTHELSAKVAEGSKQNKTLNDTKLAMMNLLEDLEESKKKVEQEVLDRTQELQAEQANLQAQNFMFDSLVSNIPVGVLLVKSDGTILYMNKLAVATIGLSPKKKYIGSNYLGLHELYHEDQTKLDVKDHPFAVATETKQLVQKKGLFIHHDDNTMVPVSVICSPVLDKQKQIISTVILLEDISKEYEVDKAKTEFVSLASHQLRTPLSSINWYTEMMLSGDAGKLTKDQKQFLDEIVVANRRMIDMVNDLLNVSRIEVGTFVIENKSLSLKTAVQSEINEILPDVKKKGIKIIEKYDESLKEIQADENLLNIVLQNLVSNAVKYTFGKGAITISVYQKKFENVDEAVIEVKDSGLGIPKAQQDKIFTKMFRADNVRVLDTDGNGLGLYMVKSILEQAGCRIWFESVEKKGTTFYVAIPLTGMKAKTGTRKLTLTLQQRS
jgi:PAS domain S-box-containing protein